jgi:hypothetical protein
MHQLDLVELQQPAQEVTCGDNESALDVRDCDNPPRKIPNYRLRPIHFGH